MSDFIQDLSARDRLDVPVCAAIKSKDFKQALKLVEKRIAKGSNAYLKAQKCFIMCNHPSVVERGKAMSEILAMTSNPDSQVLKTIGLPELEFLEESLKVLFPGRRVSDSFAVCRLRALVVKERKTDEKLAIACFRACLQSQDLESAQEIAKTLSQNFTSNRSYMYWSIVTAVLFAQTPECSETLQAFLPKIAWAQIQKLAGATQLAEGKTAPARSLQSPQELLLFNRLLTKEGTIEARMKFSTDPFLGPNSKIAKGQWVFWRQRIMMLRDGKNWQMLFDDCQELLTAARTKDSKGCIKAAWGADWLIWKSFTKAAKELDSQQTTQLYNDQLEGHNELNSGIDKTYRRNAHLALVEDAFFGPSAWMSLSSAARVTSSCNGHETTPRVFQLVKYLHAYGKTVSAFEDMKPYIEKLGFGEQEQLLEISIELLKLLHDMDMILDVHDTPRNIQKLRRLGNPTFDLDVPEKVTRGEYTTMPLTFAKLEYFIFSSMAEANRSSAPIVAIKKGLVCRWCSARTFDPTCELCLENHAIQAIRDYGTAVGEHSSMAGILQVTDKHPADDWAVTAAMCLIKLANCNPYTWGEERLGKINVKEMLQAAALLEFAWTHSKPNPQISLLLVRLYSKLGAGSLALRAYGRLGLKKVQGDTLSYVMFDRISTLHPHPAIDHGSHGHKSVDPCNAMIKVQQTYRTFRRHINSNCWKAFEGGSYDSIFQLIEVSDILSRSSAAAMTVVETRRIKRLTEPMSVVSKETQGYDLLPVDAANSNYVNNFDYLSFPNYEMSSGPLFEQYIRLGPGLSHIRTRAFLLMDELWMVVSLASKNQAKKTLALENLRKGVDHLVNEPIFENGTNFTARETVQVELFINLAATILNCCTYKKGAPFNLLEVENQCRGISNLVIGIQDALDVIRPQEPDYIPHFLATLHTLYTSYECAQILIAVADFIGHDDVQVSSGGKDTAPILRANGQKLMIYIRETIKEVKARLDEGGWLDFILDHLQTDERDAAIAENRKTPQENAKVPNSQETNPRKRKGQAKNKMLHRTIGNQLTKALGQDFMEVFAADLTDSWRDSVIGLTCLKTTF